MTSRVLRWGKAARQLREMSRDREVEIVPCWWSPMGRRAGTPPCVRCAGPRRSFSAANGISARSCCSIYPIGTGRRFGASCRRRTSGRPMRPPNARSAARLDLEPRLRRIRNYRALARRREAIKRQMQGVKKSAASTVGRLPNFNDEWH